MEYALVQFRSGSAERVLLIVIMETLTRVAKACIHWIVDVDGRGGPEHYITAPSGASQIGILDDQALDKRRAPDSVKVACLVNRQQGLFVRIAINPSSNKRYVDISYELSSTRARELWATCVMGA